MKCQCLASERVLTRSMMAYHVQKRAKGQTNDQDKGSSCTAEPERLRQKFPARHSAVGLCFKWHTVLSTLQAAHTHSGFLGLQQLRATQPVVDPTSCCFVMGCPVCVVLLCNVAHQRISCRAPIRLDEMLRAHTC